MEKIKDIMTEEPSQTVIIPVVVLVVVDMWEA